MSEKDNDFSQTLKDLNENNDNHEQIKAFAISQQINIWGDDISQVNSTNDETRIDTTNDNENNIYSNNNVNRPEMEREKMKLLLSNFNEEQMARYEAFRRANVNRGAVKKLANMILNQSITANVAVALSGMSKVFIGEIVEKARDVQKRMDHETDDDDSPQKPLRPEHLREAWRLYKLETGTVPSAHWRRQGGNGDGMLFR